MSFGQERLKKLIEDFRFEMLMGLVVVLSIAIMGTEAEMRAREETTPVWIEHGVEPACLVIFTTECGMRMYVWRRMFHKSPWNLLDLLVFGSSVVLPTLHLSPFLRELAGLSGAGRGPRCRQRWGP